MDPGLFAGFASASVVAGAVLSLARFRLSFLLPALARTRIKFKPKAEFQPLFGEMFDLLGPMLQWFLCAAVASPLVFVVLLVVDTAADGDDTLALGICLVALAFLSAGWAVALLRANGWRAFRSSKILAWLTVVLYAAYLIVFLVNLDPFTFVGSSAVWVFLSLLPMLRLLQTHSAVAPLSLSKFLRAISQAQTDGERHHHGHTTKRSLRSKLRSVGLYFASLSCLVINAVLVLENKPEAPGLGFTVLAAALVLDATLLLYHRCKLLTNPTSVGLVCVACRLSLFSFGADYWFLGHCVLYLIVCGLLVTRIVEHTYPSEKQQAQENVLSQLAEEAAAEREEEHAAELEERAAEEERARVKAEQLQLAEKLRNPGLGEGKEGEEEEGRGGGGEEGGEAAKPPLRRALEWVRRKSVDSIDAMAQRGRRTSVVETKTKAPDSGGPVSAAARFDDFYAILLFVTFCFGMETAFVNSEPDSLLLPDVMDKRQSLYGLAAMGMLILYFVALSAVLFYVRNGKLNKRLSLGTYVVLVGMTGLGSFLVDSALPVICGALGPFAVLSFGIGYLMWAKNDFNFELANLSAEETVGVSASCSFLSLPCIPRRIDDLLLRWQGVNPIWQYWTQALGVVGLMSILLAWKVSLVYGFTAGIWSIVGSQLFLLNRKWFQTFEADKFMRSLVAGFVLLVAGWAAIMFLVVDDSDEMGLRVVFASIGLPVLVLLGMTLQQWQDDGWVANTFVKRSMVLVLVAVALLATAVAIFIDLAAGLSFVIGVLLLGLTVAIVAKWRLNGFFLPAYYFWVARGILLFITVAGIVLGTLTGRYFFGCSVAWAAVGVGPLAVAVYDELAYGSRDIICSGYMVFPIYAYDPSTHALTAANRGPFGAFIALAMLFLWGLCASLFISAAYVGIWVASLALILGVVYAQRCKARTGALLARVLAFARPDVVSLAFDSAKKELEADLPLSASAGVVDEEDGLGDGSSIEEIAELLNRLGEQLATLDSELKAVVRERCSGRYSRNPFVSLFHILLRRPAPCTRTKLASVLYHDQEAQLEFSRDTRFTALLQLLINALTDAEVKDAETEFQTFLRTIGLGDATAEDMDNWPSHIQERVEAQWDEFVAGQLEQEKEQEEIRLESLEKAAKREKDRELLEEATRQQLEANRDEEVALEQARREAEAHRHLDALEYMEQLLREADDAAAHGDHPEEERIRALYRKSFAEEEELQQAEAERQARVESDWERRANGDMVVDLPRIEEELAEAEDSKFTDPDFPPNDDSLGPAWAGQGLVWERLSVLSKHMQLYEDGAEPDDIKQGQLGDCWLLSAIACVATREELVSQLFVKHDAQKGYYVVKFFKDSRWKEVVVDDYFPCTEVAGKKMLAFARSQSVREAWVQVLEKAYAKLHGHYSNIETGLVHFGLVDLTGGGSEQIQLGDADVRADINSGTLFAKLLRLRRDGYLLGAGSPEGSDETISPMGIVQGHAYSLLDVQEVDGHQLVKLRNPWGQTEWSGAWGDRSSEWTKRLKHKLNQLDANDGTFWMAFGDFVHHFASIYVCRVFDDSWQRVSLESAWEGPTAGGCVNFDTVGNNPQFSVSVSAPATVFLVVAQQDRRGEVGGNFHMSFTLLNMEGQRCPGRFSQRKVVGSSGTFMDAREVSLEIFLQPGPTPYTLLPSTFNPGEETTFTVTAYCKGGVVSLSAL